MGVERVERWMEKGKNRLQKEKVTGREEELVS